jgi:CRP-like cAMP-binding protein
MEIALQHLSKLTSLPEEELVLLFHHLIPLSVRAGTNLLTPGTIAATAWFVVSGSLRSFYNVAERKRGNDENGINNMVREVTNWIVPAGGFLTDIKSFLRQTPAMNYIEAMETSGLYSISYNNYLSLQRTHPQLASAIFQDNLIIADLRVQMSNLRSPEDRLAMFETMYPGMTGRLSVNVQASYLNIDPTTLSRLRSKKSKNIF